MLLVVWETALVAFEYAPPLRFLRDTRAALLVTSALLATSASGVSYVCSRRSGCGGGGGEGVDIRRALSRGRGEGMGDTMPEVSNYLATFVLWRRL